MLAIVELWFLEDDALVRWRVEWLYTSVTRRFLILDYLNLLGLFDAFNDYALGLTDEDVIACTLLFYGIYELQQLASCLHIQPWCFINDCQHFIPVRHNLLPQLVNAFVDIRSLSLHKDAFFDMHGHSVSRCLFECPFRRCLTTVCVALLNLGSQLPTTDFLCLLHVNDV